MPASANAPAAQDTSSALGQGASVVSESPSPADAVAPAESPDPGGEEARLREKKRLAREHFDRGLAAIQAGNNDAALAEFRASQSLYPTKVALLNAAIAEEKLERYADALRAYQELARLYGDSLDEQQRRSVAASMDLLRTKVGEIAVRSEPSGVTVVVDGVERGTTPLFEPVLVNAGTHTIRLYKEGYVPFEAQQLVAGNSRETVFGRLKLLAAAGRLRVTEAGGRKLDVIVDGAMVGKTPWEGSLAPGAHMVLLHGPESLGTAPAVASVVVNETALLALHAEVLDSTIRVEPVPTSARVHVDGTPVGNGIWEGKLRGGPHWIEVTAEGFLAFRGRVDLARNARRVVEARLTRDLSNPIWKERMFLPHLFVEALAGPALTTGLGGAAHDACAEGECSSNGLVLGYLGGVRGGYQFTKQLGFGVFIGVIGVESTVVRRQTADADVALESSDYEDSTRLGGILGGAPLLSLDASYTLHPLLERTPLSLRLLVGIARARAEFSNRGTFTGTQDGTEYSLEDFSVAERSANLWLPLAGPEVRMAYRFTRNLLVDVGLVVFAVFPQETLRTGVGQDEGVRSYAPRPSERAKGFVPGLVRLERNEAGLGTFFLLVPTVGARYEF